MDDEIRKLRALLARRERGRGKRYTAGLKEKVAVAATELRRRGRSWQRIGRFLGIPHETVRRFASARGVPLSLVPVEVAEEPERTGGAIVLVSPDGYRIEGLGVADAAELLRRLPMITLPRTIRVWACSRPSDLRKGYNGLVGLVKQVLGHDPMSGEPLPLRESATHGLQGPAVGRHRPMHLHEAPGRGDASRICGRATGRWRA